MICSGCRREIEVGDNYIEDTASGFLKEDKSDHDDLIAEIFGNTGGKIIYCQECTIPGGDYMFETYYGEEEE